jgi:hypothetical protein
VATFIPAPGVAQAVITQHMAGHKMNNVLHFYHGSTSPWSQSDLQSVANTLFTQWCNVWKNQMASNTTYQSVACVDLTNTTPVSATSTGAAVTAVGTGATSPGLSLMVQFNIASRYRGGHPRCYLPPFESGALTANEDQWISAALTAAAAGFATIVTAIVAAVPGVTHCVPRYTYLTSVDSSGKKINRVKNGYIGQFTVQSYTALPPVRSQRRRTTAGS